MNIQAIMDKFTELEQLILQQKKELIETKRQLAHYKDACDKALEIISKYEKGPHSYDIFRCVECHYLSKYIDLPLDKRCLKCGGVMYNTEEEKLSVEEILKKRA